jgi:hypothetical protein
MYYGTVYYIHVQHVVCNVVCTVYVTLDVLIQGEFWKQNAQVFDWITKRVVVSHFCG